MEQGARMMWRIRPGEKRTSKPDFEITKNYEKRAVAENDSGSCMRLSRNEK